MTKTASIGSVSHGTMRPEDLVPCFCSELLSIGGNVRRAKAIEKASEAEGYFESDECGWDLDELFEMLNDCAPEGCYFGAHPGDGSDYGFWVSDGFVEEFDGLTVYDTGDIPKGYLGLVLHVSDHGNLTLYRKTPRRLAELWSVV